jgi:hypothetical protein
MVPWTEEAYAEQDVVGLVRRVDASIEEADRRTYTCCRFAST